MNYEWKIIARGPDGEAWMRLVLVDSVPYVGRQDDGQDVADDTDDDGGYGDDEDLLMGSPAGESEEGL